MERIDPRWWRMLERVPAIVGVVIVASAAWACRSGPGTHGGMDPSIERTQTGGDPYARCRSQRNADVARFANEARSKQGRRPLHCSPDMSDVAEDHARDMCEKDYLSHIAKDGSSPAERGREAGIEFRAFGENIAKGPQSPKSAHQGWMGSAQHRKNILRPQFSRIGVGYVECGGRPIWVQVFAN